MNKKTLPFSKTQLDKIIETHPTPFHIYDEKAIRDNLSKINKAFSWNKGFKEYFAVKALPNPAILSILKDMGCGTDCASLTELMLSKHVGITGQNIMFTSNETPAEDFILAKELGAIINLDDITHIDYLEAHCGIPDTICCRYNPGGEFTLTSHIMGHLTDSKFGMTKDQLLEAFTILKEKGVKNFGIHAMLMSADLTRDYYPALARTLFNLAIEVKEKIGIDISFLDFGGGIGIPYKPEESSVDILEIGEEVRKVYEEIVTPTGMEISIFTELARFVTGPYGYLVTKVIHTKDIYKNYLGVDSCSCDLMRPAIYGAYHHITVMGKEGSALTHTYDVTGSLCENNDKFAVDRLLPETKAGDLLVIHDTGAHGYSMGYNYNGRLKSAEVLLQPDGNTRLIRKAETPKDYFSTLTDLYPGLGD